MSEKTRGEPEFEVKYLSEEEIAKLSRPPKDTYASLPLSRPFIPDQEPETAPIPGTSARLRYGLRAKPKR